jgi:flagellar motor protein MotB
MSRTARIVGVLLLIGGVSAGLGGCNKVNKTDYDAAVSENQELRDRLAQEQKARQEAETRSASLEQENHDLANRADKPGATGGKGMGADTGFSGIEGATAYRTAGGEVVVSVAGDVLFDSGKATLKTTAKRSLDKIASVIKGQYAGHTVRVEGYTDSDPIRKSGWKTNERLSGERAMAVEEYLTSRGLSKEQIYYAGFGAARPKGNKKESRRVEIVILAGRS